MHGFNQGLSHLFDICNSITPDVILLQEHWLAVTNLNKFDTFSGYFCYGSSAMSSRLESGILKGRPFGGVAVLVSNKFKHCCTLLMSSERYLIIRLFDFIIVNVYLPCVGTMDRSLLLDETMSDIFSCFSEYSDCKLLIGGDFNCDLDGESEAATAIEQFISDNELVRCDTAANVRLNTYVNVALNHSSCLDYFIISSSCNVLNYEVIDNGANLSDHMPVKINFECDNNIKTFKFRATKCTSNTKQLFLRWDHANLSRYYFSTGERLQPILESIKMIEYQNLNPDNAFCFIDSTYESIVTVLNDAASCTVPKHSQGFYKYWWNEELNVLKNQSISAHQLWVAAGRPRCGPIACKARAAKAQYKKSIRQYQQQEVNSYSNELNDALMKKNGPEFWKCWRAKFENKAKVTQVNGLSDPYEILIKFEEYFSKCCANATPDGSRRLAETYYARRGDYCGLPFSDDFLFDVALVDSCIASLKNGRAAGLDGLTAEHLKHCHPVLCSILYRLFNLMILYSHVPPAFGLSYTVPIPKNTDNVFTKSLTTDDFRGISISAIISKIFEKSILDRYDKFFETSEFQFGFKKGVGCSDAIFGMKSVIDNFIQQGSTINLCALDVSKAFDKMSHHGLFLKLMDRMIPNVLLSMLENWFTLCSTCVRWGDLYSNYIKLVCGVRQGGVLSPCLFAVYINEVINVINSSGCGCNFGILATNIFLYADDILLLAPSVSALQRLVLLVEAHLSKLDMILNPKKCFCLRIGPQSNRDCISVKISSGEFLNWVNKLRYLGVVLVSSKTFKVSLGEAKKKFYRSVNSIFSKIGKNASENAILHLIYSKCVPVILYGLDACDVSQTHLRLLRFITSRLCMKIFHTRCVDIVDYSLTMFGYVGMDILAKQRAASFRSKYAARESFLLFYNLHCT